MPNSPCSPQQRTRSVMSKKGGLTVPVMGTVEVMGTM